ncbi:MAG: hypothetical protein ACLTSZ_14825 [Lachnospiraceae bacterium]
MEEDSRLSHPVERVWYAAGYEGVEQIRDIVFWQCRVKWGYPATE